MQVSVEKISNVQHKLSISVPAEDVESVYKTKINDFAKKANLKGFRPGKAPLSYIQKLFGQDARNQAITEVMQKAAYDAIIDQKLKPVSTPQITPKVLSEGEPLEFDVLIDVLPEIEKVNFTLDNLERLKVDVTDTDIDYVINQLAKQYTEWNPVDRPAQLGDRVIINFHPVVDGQPDMENKAEDYPLELGSKMMIPGFEDALIDTKAHDEKTINLTFPEDYHVKNKAGKPVTFVINVKEVVEAKKPALDEEFFKRLGIASGKLEDCQKTIKQSLEQERDRLVKDHLKEQVFKRLLEENPIDVPESLIEREAQKIHDEIYPSHKKQKEHHHDESELAQFKENAKKRVAVGIIISEYANQAKIKLEKERVDKRIKEIASVYEHSKEVEAWLSSSEERRSDIESQVLEDQILESLIQDIKTTEKVMTYAALKGFNI